MNGEDSLMPADVGRGLAIKRSQVISPYNPDKSGACSEHHAMTGIHLTRTQVWERHKS